MTHVLALDIGTSSVRARLYDESGEHVAGVEAQTPYGPAEAGVDADELVAVIRAALDEARSEAGREPDALAVSCFWHSLLAVDGHGRPLTPLLTWRDVRAASEADELASLLGGDAVHARTGCPLHPSFWPAKLLWLKRHREDVFRAAAAFLSFPEYLLGSRETSPSMASGTGLLGLDGRWDDELLAAVGIEPDRLPEVSGEPLVFGDGACANVGVGAVEEGRACLSIGTSGALRLVVEPGRVPRPGLFLYRLDADRLVEGGAISDGGNLLDWLGRTLRAEKPADEAGGVAFAAQFGGERSPGWDPRARGAITGLTFDTTPEQIYRAALEGVARTFAEIAALMPDIREIIATGGAFRGVPEWVPILAEALGLPVTLSEVEEASARGAALLALERLSASDSLAQ
jgi:gluconokinase